MDCLPQMARYIILPLRLPSSCHGSMKGPRIENKALHPREKLLTPYMFKIMIYTIPSSSSRNPGNISKSLGIIVCTVQDHCTLGPWGNSSVTSFCRCALLYFQCGSSRIPSGSERAALKFSVIWPQVVFPSGRTRTVALST